MDKVEKEIDILLTNFGTVREICYNLAVLPWGATEPHNLHLPYLTDCYLSHDVAVMAAREALEKSGVRCMVLPPIPLGQQNPGQWQQPFCIHARYETQKAVLSDIVISLYRQGLRKLVIVNGHGGNCFKNMIRDMVFEFPDFLIVVVDWFSVLPQTGYFERHDDHAGELETSAMLYLRPELVNLDDAGKGEYRSFAVSSLREKTGWTPRNWERVSDDTGVGDPRLSSKEKGEKFIRDVSGKIAELFVQIVRDDLYE